jgi:hypothetical protein
VAERERLLQEIQAINDEIDRLLYGGMWETAHIGALFARRNALQQQWLAEIERLRTPGEPVTRRAGRTKLLDRARVMVWGRR